MRFEHFGFGSIRIDGTTYNHDMVIDRGASPQAQEEIFQTISQRIRTYATLHRREDTLEVPAPRNRNWRRCLAGHEGSKARSSAPQY